MTAEPYPAYVLRDLEWLKEAPSGWGVKPLKAVAEALSGGTPDTENEDFWAGPDSGTAWAAISDMSSTDSVCGTTKALTAAGITASRLIVGEPGTVLFAMYASVGEVSQLAIRATWNQALLGFRPREDVMIPKYLFYSLKSAKPQLPFLYRSNTQNNLNAQQVSNIKVTVPPVGEQWQIAQYLDVHTAKIDVLIEKQERLIETLTERRQAVIDHAVTKGLDPNAPMKATGFEWVGDIPESWTMKRVSWLFKTVGSGTTPPSGDSRYYGEGASWVTTGELRETIITETSKSVTAEALAAFPTLRVYGPGTLIIAMYGATIGRLGELGVSACTNQACCAMSEPVGILTRFAHYSLLAAKKHVLVLAVGGGQPNINQETVRGLRIPTPPLSEQQVLVGFLDHETAKISALSAKAREMIDVLKERRQALISAAVTGKIDVRGLS